jgi:septal ring factor EnvC (AmiA/AmiB activator)
VTKHPVTPPEQKPDKYHRWFCEAGAGPDYLWRNRFVEIYRELQASQKQLQGCRERANAAEVEISRLKAELQASQEGEQALREALEENLDVLEAVTKALTIQVADPGELSALERWEDTKRRVLHALLRARAALATHDPPQEATDE